MLRQRALCAEHPDEALASGMVLSNGSVRANATVNSRRLAGEGLRPLWASSPSVEPPPRIGTAKNERVYAFRLCQVGTGMQLPNARFNLMPRLPHQPLLLVPPKPDDRRQVDQAVADALGQPADRSGGRQRGHATQIVGEGPRILRRGDAGA